MKSILAVIFALLKVARSEREPASSTFTVFGAPFKSIRPLVSASVPVVLTSKVISLNIFVVSGDSIPAT